MLWRVIATVFFIGYFPFAPGTLVCLLCMLFLIILKPSLQMQLLILLFSFILGIISSQKVEKKDYNKDPSYIVIDEFSGYLTSVIFHPVELKVLVLGLIIFRVFDILKPLPIKYIEKRFKKGLSIMVDDILAGVFANLLLRFFLML
ncbi:MAG: phosphatidylglycerophosphatase A [Thermodesulfovibrionaceae bacterium]